MVLDVSPSSWALADAEGSMLVSPWEFCVCLCLTSLSLPDISEDVWFLQLGFFTGSVPAFSL